jgi:hypothetical protein
MSRPLGKRLDYSEFRASWGCSRLRRAAKPRHAVISVTSRGPTKRTEVQTDVGNASSATGDRVRAGRCTASIRIVVFLALSCLVGCASLAKKSTQPDLRPWPQIRPDFRVETLRTRMVEYSITFAAQVDFASTAIEGRAADATVQRNALLWRVRAIPEMRKACFRLEAVSALIDAWIFARQMDQLFSEGAGANAFGTFQPEAIEVARRLVDQLRQIGDSIAVSSDARAEFEHNVIDPWLAEHPLRDITFVRESPIAQFAEQSRAGGDTFQSVGTMEELAVSLSRQARIYLADLPRQLRGEIDLMRSDMLPADTLGSMQRDLHLSAAAADRLAASAEGMLPMVLSERRIVLEEMNRQRALVMAALTLEREQAIDGIIQALATERRELLLNLESQRLATLEWATAERREATAEVRRELAASIDALRGERAVVIVDLRQIVDQVLLRVALFLVAAVLLAPIIAHVYARVWPRRWREP